MGHLSSSDVDDFLAGHLGAAERNRLVRHLLTGCRPCCRLLAAAVPDVSGELPSSNPPAEDAYDAAFARAMGSVGGQELRWREERERLERGLSLMRVSSEGYDGLSFEQVQELQGWPLVEALLQESFEARYRNPETMRWLAYNAMTAAEGLRPEEYGQAFVFDMRARAWAELGNAYRVNDELDEAEEALGKASELLRQGTGDLLLLAHIADLEASLRSDQRRLSDACELLDGVYRLYLELNDRHLAGRALVSKGIAVSYGGDFGRSIQLLREGLSLLDPKRDPQLMATSQQMLLSALVENGEFHEAGSLLLESGLRKTFAADPLNLLKLRWVEGKIFAGLGKLPRAEHALTEVRNGFLQMGKEYDAALVGLELASVWLRQEKGREVRQLSQSMLDTFRSLGIHQEAVKAMRFLQEACEREAATVQLVDEVRGFLGRLQREPQLRFELA